MISEIKQQVYPHMRDLLGQPEDDTHGDYQERHHIVVHNFANEFCCLKLWINEVSLAITQQNVPIQSRLQMILDIIFLSCNYDKLLRDRKDLCKKINSIEDLHKPSTWLSRLEDHDGEDNVRAVRRYAYGTRVFTSGCGRLGYVPEASQKGDLVVIFYGVPTPLVIRETQAGYYEILGPAYVHGVMQGEFISDKNPPFKEFLLI